MATSEIFDRRKAPASAGAFSLSKGSDVAILALDGQRLLVFALCHVEFDQIIGEDAAVGIAERLAAVRVEVFQHVLVLVGAAVIIDVAQSGELQQFLVNGRHAVRAAVGCLLQELVAERGESLLEIAGRKLLAGQHLLVFQ